MFVRLTHVQSKPGQMGDVVALYQSVVLPLLQQQPGFSSTQLLTDPLTNKGISMTVWETETDRQAADSNGFLLEQIMKVMPFLTAQPISESYIVEPG
ncbi:antibiotic biosynthesis monooxygenase family protein [Undibacterium sp. Di27W]